MSFGLCRPSRRCVGGVVGHSDPVLLYPTSESVRAFTNPRVVQVWSVWTVCWGYRGREVGVSLQRSVDGCCTGLAVGDSPGHEACATCHIAACKNALGDRGVGVVGGGSGLWSIWTTPEAP